jgi:hypothetical protein
MISTFSKQNTKRVFASLLVAWLSGVVFLLCCQMTTAQASEMESCPLAKMDNCRKSSAKNDSSFVSIPREQNALDCCKIPAKIFDKARKLEKNQETAKVADKIIVSAPKFLFINPVFEAPKVQSVIRDRGSTFLENCVFRI